MLLAALASFLHAKVPFTKFENGNTFIQILPFDPKNEWITVTCRDKVMRLETKNHLSTFHNTHIFRAHIAVFDTKMSFSCFLFLPNEMLIAESSARPLLGRVHENQLPDELFFPEVTVVDRNNPHYTFTDDPLQVLPEYADILEQMAPHLKEELRQANLRMKPKEIKVFLSLTTSPSRLLLLQYTLRSLNLDLVDVIFVVLPRRFKEKETYLIPTALQREFPKIVYLSEERDFGPISKLASSVQYVQDNYDSMVADESIFITIDDDNVYLDSTVDTLVYLSLLNRESAITTASWQYFLRTAFGVPCYEERPILGGIGTRVSDIEGFAGVAYRSWQVDYKQMKFFVDKARDPRLMTCCCSDDIVISILLMLRDVQIIRGSQHPDYLFYARCDRLELPHFTDENALHLIGVDGSRTQHNSHSEKYQHCMMEMLSHLIDISAPNLAFKDIPLFTERTV